MQTKQQSGLVLDAFGNPPAGIVDEIHRDDCQCRDCKYVYSTQCMIAWAEARRTVPVPDIRVPAATDWNSAANYDEARRMGRFQGPRYDDRDGRVYYRAGGPR